MDMQEMALRLGNLERARSEDMQKMAQQAFMDKYGSRVSNNESLGLVILNELNRRGVDVSAADEAVQQILDQLRMEATALLDTIKDTMTDASDLIDKVDTMQEAVEVAGMATGADMSQPSAAMNAGELPPVEPMEPPMPPEGGDMGGMPPEGGDMGGMPPEGGGMGGMPPEGGDMGGMPPEGGEPAPAPAPEEMPPQNTPSDARIKRVQAMRAHMPKPKATGMKLDSNIISACRGL